MADSDDDEVPMLPSAALLESRGWSRTLIKKHLDEPDLVKKRFKQPGVIHLFSLERVLDAEAQPTFQRDLEKVARRRHTGRQVALQRGEALQEKARSYEPQIATWLERATPKKILLCSLQGWVPNGSYATAQVPNLMTTNAEYLLRLARNYVRHECSDWDDTWTGYRGLPGCQESYDLARTKIDQAVDALLERRGVAKWLDERNK